jgi:hypothetical protein
MSLINGYVTLAEFKEHHLPETATDTADDGVISTILEAASRKFDDETLRTFYPRVETRCFDSPSERQMNVDDDLLEVLTLTNGDTSTLAATEYNLVPKNVSPAYAVKLKEASAYYWTLDSSGNLEDAIDLIGIWGYHDRYSQRAWLTGSTVNESLTASDLTITMTSGTLFSAGQIIRMENELCIVASVSDTAVTVSKRGDNGSTAATHASTTPVYIWQPMTQVKQAVMEKAVGLYMRKHGQSAVDAAPMETWDREIINLRKRH